MRRWTPLLLLTFGVLLAPRLLWAAVVLNEITFDPVGTDTGLEKIEIYNPHAASADLGGWELYPDGIGYFTFPAGFSLAAKSFAVVHLRASGTNDAQNLYHASATGNMGNSSGSVALFRPGGRSEDTIVDFVRYHKPGASEKKTWESAAAEAGLWTAGTFVDTSGLSEGSSIGLTADGARGSAASWQTLTSPSLGSANAAGDGSVPPSSPPPAGSPPAGSAPAPPPSLGADAGADVAALAGTLVPFRGQAYGLDGEPLDGARFLWNFGDGSVREGRSVTHVYHFPGTYRANLLVSSSPYTGSAWRTITVSAPAVTITEVKPGEGGFVELWNAARETVDISGLNLADDRDVVFHTPPGTAAAAESAIVLPAAITRLDPRASLELRDARGVLLDQARFGGSLPAGSSWQRVGERFVASSAPTPGAFATPPPAGGPPPGARSVLPPPPAAVMGTAPPPLPPEAPKEAEEGLPVSSSATAPSPLAGIAVSSRLFLAASIILGAVTAVGIVLLKRMAP